MSFSPEEMRAYEQIKMLVIKDQPVAIVLGGQPFRKSNQFHRLKHSLKP